MPDTSSFEHGQPLRSRLLPQPCSHDPRDVFAPRETVLLLKLFQFVTVERGRKGLWRGHGDCVMTVRGLWNAIGAGAEPGRDTGRPTWRRRRRAVQPCGQRLDLQV